MFTVKQVAEQLNISATCVYQLVSTGKLACHRIGIGRGAIRVSEDDLRAFISASRNESEHLPPSPSQRLPSVREFKHLRLPRKPS